jgi:ABC-type antimicrobial peptide transport system permease subunit
MIKNFFLVAIRNFLRQRFYSLINVFGLSTGLASALFIFLWVNDELNVDAGYADADRLYRIISNLKVGNGEILTWDITPGPMGDEVMENIPEVEVAVRTMNNGSQLIQFNEKSALERGLYGDSTFFKVFDFKILQGTANTIDRSSIAISKKLATSLFGDNDPIGRVVKVSKKYDLEVKAVFDDIERGTTMRFDYILPMDIYRIQRGDGWDWGNYDHPLYLKLVKGASPGEAIRKINELVARREKELYPDEAPSESRFMMVPLKEYYLNSHYVNGVPDGGRIQYVRIFSVVAIFIVLIACINFMNMATARAVQRAKEVGVRKVVGAQRSSLIWQFIGESIITTMLSMLVAIGLVYAMLPVFNEIVSKKIMLDFGDPLLLASCFLIVVIAGLTAGAYPAFFLSSYKPATVLKGTVSPGLRGATLRKGLVVFQFALTVIMVASALVVMKQVDYIQSKDLGYDRKARITFYGSGDIANRFDAFKTEAEKIPGVELVARSNNSLVQVSNQNRSVSWPGRPDNDYTFFRTVVVDYQFLDVMGLKLKEGRLFNQAIGDTASFVVTEKAVEVMGLDNPIGTKISQWGHQGSIVGVVEDFHSRSLHEAIDPVVFMFRPDWKVGVVVVRYDAGKTSSVLSGIEKLAKQFAPEYPFNYSFVDQDFERLYSIDKMTGNLALGFTVIAIIISGLGLLALAAYTAERRKKEISIRKTLGASVGAVVTLMARDFAKLSLIAAGIGCPIAWYLMSLFLEGYAYHTDLSADVFLITAVMVIFISILTVIFQVARAAVANPVDALRNE